MQITVKLGPTCNVIDTINDVPVVALAFDIKCTGRIENTGTSPLTIEDPGTSQKITVNCKSDGNPETMFLLHPSIVDGNGVATCPPVEEIRLKKGDGITVEFGLYTQLMDKCFSPGSYEVTMAYDSIRSEPCKFIIVIDKQSVPRLLSIVDDASIDAWVRKESLRWLKQVRPSFAYDFTDSRDNAAQIDAMKKWWKENKDSDAVRAFFAALNQ